MQLLKITAFIILTLSTAFAKISEVYPPLNDSNVSNSLFFGLIMSFGGSFNSSGTVPAVQIALDLINSNHSLLSGYTLHYVLSDSQCNHTVALGAFFDQILNSHPRKVALIGAGCSVATEPIADIIHFYNITQISCASSSSMLANRIRYKTYFQLLPTEIDLIPAVVSICREYNWKHVVVVVQDENLFTLSAETLKTLFDRENISLTAKKFESRLGILSLGKELFGENERIYFLAMYAPNARLFLCEAFKLGKLYPKYAYITYGWYNDKWWFTRMEQSSFTCTQSEMQSILKYSLAITQYPLTTNANAPTAPSGITNLDFNKRYTERLEQLGYSYLVNGDHCFDAVMALALALNNTINEGVHLNFTFQDFNYKSANGKSLMLDYLSQTEFFGGPVSFQSNGIRTVKNLRILQYRTVANEFRLMDIAVVSSNDNGSLLSTTTNISIWPYGVPYDGIPTEETVSIHISVTVIYFILTFAGQCFAIACLVFNFVFRKHKIIKLSSPQLNYLIIVGADIIYLSAIVYVIPAFTEEAETILCNLRPRIFSLGYSLCFGSILAKMWRVYYIFNNPNLKKKAIKDWHLLMLVTIIVIIDILLIGALSGFEGGRTRAKLIRKKEHPSSIVEEIQDYKTDYFTYVRDSVNRDIWLGIVYGYKALLQLAALFLAFGTRKVTMKGLNDSTYIAIIIYFTSVVITVTIITTVSLNEYVNTFSSLLATCIFVTSTVILALTFIPKMYIVYKDPKDTRALEQIFHISTNATIMQASSAGQKK